MTNVVSDVSGNRNDKIANAAEFLKRSEDRKKVFRAVYSGKKVKKISEIQEKSKLSNKIRVLQECQKLHGEDMIDKLDKKLNNETVYIKKQFYNHNRNKILGLANNPKKLNRLPTKVNPKPNGSSYIKLELPKKMVDIKKVTIDEIDSFSKIKKLHKSSIKKPYEKEIKEVFKKALGETGTFTDWGGENNDLFTTRLISKGIRYQAVFGFKGRGTKGILTPNKMGKNGDQIQRLFKSSADFFFIQYIGQIDESIIYQMNQLAVAKSALEGRRIYFGIIDGKDTVRILNAYR